MISSKTRLAYLDCSTVGGGKCYHHSVVQRAHLGCEFQSCTRITATIKALLLSKVKGNDFMKSIFLEKKLGTPYASFAELRNEFATLKEEQLMSSYCDSVLKLLLAFSDNTLTVGRRKLGLNSYELLYFIFMCIFATDIYGPDDSCISRKLQLKYKS